MDKAQCLVISQEEFLFIHSFVDIAITTTLSDRAGLLSALLLDILAEKPHLPMSQGHMGNRRNQTFS